MVSGYDDCERVLRSSKSFARDWRRVGQSIPDDRISIQNIDPPDHLRLHSVFMAATRAQPVDDLCRRAAARTHSVLVSPTRPTEFEITSQFAIPFALDVMSGFLGVRVPPVGEFADVSEAVMRAMDGGLRPDAAEAGIQARAALTELVESWYSGNRSPVGALGHVQEAVRKSGSGEFDPQQVRNTARVMFQGGYSTLVAAVGNLVHIIATRPDVQNSMRRMDTGDLIGAVDEILRFDGPVQGTTRVTTADVTLGDHLVPAAQNVLCLLASANRDVRMFKNADELDLGRTPNRHMAFGWGAHACIASAVARSALVASARVLLTDDRRITLVEPGRRRDTATLRAYDRLAVCSEISA